MKITKIEITDFHQFKDLTIDLTYPKGHEKEGKPLDKVCFIGQSGTGKTTLLELIPKFLYHYDTNVIIKNGVSSILNVVFFEIRFGLEDVYTTTLEFSESTENKSTPYTRLWSNHRYKDDEVKYEEILDFYIDKWIKEIASKLVYFPANLKFDLESNSESTLLDRNIIDFSRDNISIVWNLLLERIQTYQEQELQIRQEISKTVEQSSNNLSVIKKALQKLEDWKKSEFNPIQDIADNCLNQLLTPFKLRVKTELDIKSKEDIGFIKIEDYDGNEVPNGLWSTGTKQVILSALPLYLLKPKHTVILFDEPERSLYPDMQRFIIDYYQSLTEDCQFFYSTHSPIIASKFEPWEIVELKFNEEGKVYRELYYEGENDVENYVVDPRFLNYDLILSKVFDVKNDDETDLRVEGITELTMLKNQLERLKAEKNLKSKEGKEIFNRYQKLATKLAWNKELADA